MTKVKGIYRGNTVQLLEPVKAPDGSEVEVIFPEPMEKDELFLAAMNQELNRMEKGLKLGDGPDYRSNSPQSASASSTEVSRIAAFLRFLALPLGTLWQEQK